jgi:hypothetical protein
VAYCNRTCQQAAWKAHKKECKKNASDATANADGLIAGPLVSLLDHLDSPCFGGKGSFIQLAKSTYFKACTRRGSQLEQRDVHTKLHALADGGNAHAQFLWGKLLYDETSGLTDRSVCPHDDGMAQRYWQQAAEKRHAYAVEGLGTLAQRRGDWAEAMPRWNQALALCVLPAAAFNLGVTHDPHCADSPRAYDDYSKALNFYRTTARAKLARASAADPMDRMVLMLGSGNECQSIFLDLGRKNHSGLLGRGLEKQFKQLQAEGECSIGKSALAQLPPLYPGDTMVDWGNLPGDPAMQHVPPQVMSMLTMMGRNLGHQDELDFRYGHMQHLVGTDKSAARRKTEWVGLYRQAGMLLEVPGSVDAAAPVSFEQVAGWKFSNLEAYRRPSAPIPRACDHCGKMAARRCRCGEAFCDHACLQREWSNHQSICETVLENSLLAATVKKLYWRAPR